MVQKKEIYKPHQAKLEAERCLMCDGSPCNKSCPAGIDVTGFIRRIRFDHMEGALRKIKDANILGGVCGWICPTELLCAKECTNTELTRPIDIGGLQRYVVDCEMKGSLSVCPSTGSGRTDRSEQVKKIAIIGSGPAGLSAAASLAVRGYSVTIFDSKPKSGGVLRYGIPSFRLPEEVLDYEIGFIKDKLGVEFKLNTSIDNLGKLKNDGFDAIFLSHGLGKSRQLKIPGEDLAGVFDAIDFLSKVKYGEKPRLGKRVLVIGGGGVAMDAAYEAKNLGAEKVFGVCLEDYNEMPAAPSDKEDAWNSGVEYLYRVMPLEILGDGKVTGFKGININWKKPGNFSPSNAEKIDGTEFELKVDTIIVAIGQTANNSFGLDTTSAGFIKIEGKSCMTSQKGVFAGGDAVHGPALAVEAVQDGKDAAEGIDKFLSRCHSERSEESSVHHYSKPKTDISVDFCGVHFENPFILSAAPPSDDLDMVREAFKAGWAGAVLKTTSIETEKVDLAYPMMTGMDYDGKKVIGFGNIDLISEHHIDEIEERVAALKKEFPEKVVIASMMGSKKEEWQELVRRLKKAGVDMIECSFSCPQGTLGSKPGAMLAQDTELTKTVAGWVKEAAGDLPVVIKITPQVEDIVETAQAVKDAGCDAVCASNTIPSLMGVDLETWIPNPSVGGKTTYSGMSGPAIKPLTLKCISEISRRVGIPITGTGGPTTWKDAAEFMLCGATTVQFCTAVMHYGYGIIEDLKEGVKDYLDRRGIKSVSEIIGRSTQFITTHDELPRQKELRSRIDKDLCIRCQECVIACRDGGHQAIKGTEDRVPEVDDEKCVGCGLCGVICPVEGCVELIKK